jgi:hypothetical protein
MASSLQPAGDALHLAEAVEHALEEQGDDDDDGADGRDDPCRRVLQRYLPCTPFPSSNHGQNQRPTSSSSQAAGPLAPFPLFECQKRVHCHIYR